MQSQKQSRTASQLIGTVFAGRLREARTTRGWTQQDLADELGRIGAPMDSTTIAKVEKGQREVRLAELIAIAAALDVAPMHLLLQVTGDKTASLEKKLTVDLIHERDWASERRALDKENTRF